MPPSIDPTAASRQALRANSRRELAGLTFDHLQQREDHWAVVDLIGKTGHIRTVPVPDRVKQMTDGWVGAAGVGSGRLFRRLSGRAWGEGMTEKVVWRVVKEPAAKLGVAKLATHDLRRPAPVCVIPRGWRIGQI
jgi:integrase